MLKDLIGGNDIEIINLEENINISKKEPQLKLFDYVKLISETNLKTDVQKGYSPFMVNRIFSDFIDCVLVIGKANRTSFLNDQSHFDFLQKSITTKTKRYSKKSNSTLEEVDNLIIALMLSKKWKCSVREALLNLQFLTDVEKLQQIKGFVNILDDYVELNKTYQFSIFNKSQIEESIKRLKEL